MASGRERTFDEFAWNSSQTAAVQRANVQSAFNSGEPLRMPLGELVQTDMPLQMNVTTSLIGTGRSTIQCNDQTADVLQIGASNCLVEGFNITHPGMGSGSGIVIGPNADPSVNGGYCIYVTLRRMFTTVNNAAGVHVKAAGGFSIEGGNIWGRDAILIENIINSDAGDNKIHGVDLNADAASGAGIRWLSGGGLGVSLCKFGQGFNHLKVSWKTGASGGLEMGRNRLEGCTGISVDIDGTVPFERMVFDDNNWGVGSCAIVVRNFQASPWLKQLNITDNVVKIGGRTPAFDIGSAAQVLIEGNNIDGTGQATAGIITRSPCTGAIGTNYIRNINGIPIQNWSSTAVNVAPFQG